MGPERRWRADMAPQRAPTGHSGTPATRDPYADVPTGPTEACNGDPTCYRILDRRTVQRRAADGSWRDEVRFSEDEFNAISTGCAGEQRGVLRSVSVADGSEGALAVVSLGAEGVLARDERGRWVKHAVLNAPPTERSALDRTVAVGVIVAGPVLPIIVWLAGRRRWPRPASGVAVAAAGWMVTVGVVGIAVMGNDTGSISPVVTTSLALAGLGVTAVAAIAVAHRPVPEASERDSR